VRARWLDDGALEVSLAGITTQARYYKPLVYEFFRKEFPARPRWGEVAVEISMSYNSEDPPRLDLDNLAKALLDSMIGFVYHDDSQINRLLCQRQRGERDQIVITVRAVGSEASA
jgi:Holliday junction resolvase RusA-like endonuclease